ncbi:MAG TPA: cardiolipin synthase [Candidatus Tetragenococcus pullicola]|nr:cardiolipin synthase [Candidatus Tetragenococcus pullicola]
MNFHIDISVIYNILVGLLTINTIIAFITVFRKPRSIASVLAWMVTLVFLPGIGFILYAFCGRGIDGEIIYRFSEHHQSRLTEINDQIKIRNQAFKKDDLQINSQLLQKYFINSADVPLTKGNEIEFVTDGQEKFARLFEDIRQAKDNVHVEYYAFFDDAIGHRFLDLLVEKAQEGVEVRLIFDPWGGQSSIKMFKPLIEAGGKVVAFITSRGLIRKTRLNYHLHRKIVIIDGKISWTGGFNVGDQYLEITEKFGYWRDTHARIVGMGSFLLQEIFIKDWNASVVQEEDSLDYEDRYFVFPEEKEVGETSMQVVADGPESSQQIIKGGFLKMILGAEKRVWIQTPYLIPDDSMLDALLIAVRSGVDVRIMIPCKPDHPFIYRATQYYANQLQKQGVKIYIYDNGFLHAKTILTDNEISSVGTTNQDIRSYDLNFEVNAFCYDPKVNQKVAEIFEKDMEKSTLLTAEIIKKQSYWLRFRQNFSRLLSPIL